MRKVFCILSALSLLLLLCACGKTTDDGADAETYKAELETLRQENANLTAQLAELQTSQEPEGMPQSVKNPIDDFFDAIDTSYMNTVEMNNVASCRANAWADELWHLQSVIQEQLPLEEDRRTLDDYFTTATAEQMERMHTMTLFVCGDLETPQSDRLATSGTIRGVLWGENAAQLYRDTFYQLLNVNPASYWEGSYEFAFDPVAAQQTLDGMQVG